MCIRDRDYAQALSAQKENISDILEAQHDNSVAVHYDGRSVSLGGIISSLKVRTTKNKQIMANAVLEDLSGSIGLIIFPRTYAEVEGLLANDAVLRICLLYTSFYHENKYLFRQVLFCKQQVFATNSKDNLVVLACLIT